MIKVRLYTEEEYIHALTIDGNGSHDHVFDYKSSFDSVLYNLHDHDALPFRDIVSRRFLKEIDGITFINDDDWYTVMWDNERTCIAAIPKELKFALMAIEHSRRGRYTWFCPAGDKIWELLADMPFDILIGMRITEMGICGSKIGGADYQVINYPYGGKTVEVTVKHDGILYGDDFYTEVPEGKEHSTSYGLHLGKDGKYYFDMYGIGYALQYYWKNDIEGIIEYIGKKDNNRLRLADINQEYNVFEYAKALGKDGDELVSLDYLHILGCYNRIRAENGMDDYDEAVQELQSGDSYQEYLYFRDKFKVISHLTWVPEGTTFRKLPMLMVDKNSDGSYWVHGSLTYKYPDFCDAIHQVIDERSQSAERYVLIIDAEEMLGSVKDIDSAVYGFKVMPDSLEVFEVEDAVRLFGQMLKEAVTSGRCKVDNEFY